MNFGVGNRNLFNYLEGDFAVNYINDARNFIP